MVRKPVIGITPDLGDLPCPNTEYVIRRNYTDVVAENGGLPVILPYSQEVDGYLSELSGLVVTGGMFDIDPTLYGQVPKKSLITKPVRTNFEKAMIEGALTLDVPILGICNGMQLLAVCLGGKIIQDIPTECPAAIEHKPSKFEYLPQHEIELTGKSRFIRSNGPRSYVVNSIHHQAVLPHTAYSEIAIAPDGIVEGIESIGRGFAVGVQWHPEFGVSEVDALVWTAFMAACRDYVASNNV